MNGTAELASFVELRREIAAAGWFSGADESLGATLSAAVTSLADPVPAAVAVVAVGGLGRGALALRSDADVWILHRGSPIEDFAGRVFRPLWDAGLRVGHGFHTPESARMLAGSRLDALCTLLSSRLLVGDPALLDELMESVGRLIDRDPGRILDALAVEELDRRRREPYLEMAADLKTGRGGIRTLDLVDWRRRITAAAGLSSGAPTERERQIRATLLELRSALHAVTGRAHDRYDFELRSAAATWSRVEIRSLGRRLLGARVAAEDLVDETWDEVTRQPGRRGGPAPSHPRLRALAASLRHPGVVSLPLADPPFSPSDRSFILALVDDEALVRRLAASGWLAGVLPALAALRTEPHVVPFHRYAVFDHLLATLDELRRLEAGDPSVPLLAEILPAAGDLELVAWAALFHDLGKGGDEDHSQAGARIARETAIKIGFSAAVVADLARLVELHLLLPDLATRFDLDHPQVRSWAADRIGDLATLRYLYLLTVADSRATGSDTWSDWRAELVRRAYRRLERELTRRSLPEPVQVGVLADQVLEASGNSVTREAVVAHLSGLSGAYRSSHTPGEIAAHVRLGSRALGPEGVLIDVIEPEEHGGPASIVVSCPDRRGLLTVIAGTMALHRMSVLDARVATRSDGRVFDTFAVVDALDKGRVGPATVSAFSHDLGRAVRGGFDVEGALAAKQLAYRHARRAGVAPAVSVRKLPTGGGVIEIECADRLGLLHDVGRVIAGHGMGILRARVDTRAAVAYDSFTVERLPSDTASLESALLAVISLSADRAAVTLRG